MGRARPLPLAGLLCTPEFGPIGTHSPKTGRPAQSAHMPCKFLQLPPQLLSPAPPRAPLHRPHANLRVALPAVPAGGTACRRRSAPGGGGDGRPCCRRRPGARLGQRQDPAGHPRCLQPQQAAGGARRGGSQAARRAGAGECHLWALAVPRGAPGCRAGQLWLPALWEPVTAAVCGRTAGTLCRAQAACCIDPPAGPVARAVVLRRPAQRAAARGRLPRALARLQSHQRPRAGRVPRRRWVLGLEAQSRRGAGLGGRAGGSRCVVLRRCEASLHDMLPHPCAPCAPLPPGDHIKHSLTTAQASTFLAWAALDFAPGLTRGAACSGLQGRGGLHGGLQVQRRAPCACQPRACASQPPANTARRRPARPPQPRPRSRPAVLCAQHGAPHGGLPCALPRQLERVCGPDRRPRWGRGAAGSPAVAGEVSTQRGPQCSAPAAAAQPPPLAPPPSPCPTHSCPRRGPQLLGAARGPGGIRAGAATQGVCVDPGHAGVRPGWHGEGGGGARGGGRSGCWCRPVLHAAYLG